MNLVHKWYRDAYYALKDYRYHVDVILDSPKGKKGQDETTFYVNNKKLEEFQKVIDKAEEFFTNPKETQVNVKLSDFVRRQTKDSEFSYFDGTDEELLQLVNIGGWRQGYREGVQLVRALPDKFYSSLCQLKEGDKLSGAFKARQEGEQPRKSTYKVGGEKMPAQQVDIVLYHKDVLAEGNERSTDADWEIVSINASPVEGEMPIAPGVLMANHFQWSGGTATNMSDEEFAKQLKISAEWWKDKCLLEPNNG